jgi:hypothetical protein
VGYVGTGGHDSERGRGPQRSPLIVCNRLWNWAVIDLLGHVDVATPMIYTHVLNSSAVGSRAARHRDVSLTTADVAEGPLVAADSTGRRNTPPVYAAVSVLRRPVESATGTVNSTSGPTAVPRGEHRVGQRLLPACFASGQSRPVADVGGRQLSGTPNLQLGPYFLLAPP